MISSLCLDFRNIQPQGLLILVRQVFYMVRAAEFLIGDLASRVESSSHPSAELHLFRKLHT